MAFVLAKETSYSRPVPFDVPVDGDEETGFEKQEITIRFRDTRTSEALAILDKVNAEEITDAEICREVIVGWGDDVVDEKGKAVPFSPEALELLLERRFFASAALAVFFDSLRGRKVKNLPMP
jgi:hypothetical protein